jgi:uncharacterized protein (DUF1800 family)
MSTANPNLKLTRRGLFTGLGKFLRPAAPSAPPLPPLAVIAINRMAFGPKPGAFDTATFASMPGASANDKLAAFVDWQLNPAAINDSACDSLVAAANLPSLTKSLTQLWSDYYKAANADRTRPVKDVRAATFLRAVYSQRQLFEMMVSFWHNHFSVYAWDYAYASATWSQYDRDVIRANALGNFRQMLGAVATSPAMLFYLANYENQDGGPNENWAREVFELHSMGAENYLGVMEQASVPGYPSAPSGYVDADVYEATRCFTGWRVNDGQYPLSTSTGEFLYYDAWHDRFQKTVLGHFMSANRGPQADGLDVLDLLANHPGTARFISRKLCRRFIGDNPPQIVVDAAAAVFTANKDAPDQMARVLRVILLSDAFKSTWGEKIKTPFEVAVSLLRASNAVFSPTDSFFWRFEEMNQPLFAHRTPDGYKDVKEAWSNTTSMLNRWQLNLSMIESGITGTTVDINSQMPANITTSNDVVDFWINRIFGRPLSSDSQRSRIVDFMRGPYTASFSLPASYLSDRLPRMVELLLMVPDFQYR